MPPLAVIGPVIGAATSLAGGLIGSNGAAAEGANAEALGKYQAEQFQQEGYTSVARAQRKMEEQQRTGTLVQSTLQARGAADGVNPSVGSTAILNEQIAGRNTYSALSDLAAGQDQAAGFENQAAAAQYSGDLKESMVPEEQFASIAGGASSAFGSLGKLAGSVNFG